MKKGKTAKAKPIRQRAFAVRKLARWMLPFYEKVACDARYAVQWAKAVRETDIAEMQILLRKAIGRRPIYALASNSVGYFIDIPLPKPLLVITNGTTIQPGLTQHTFNSAVHRAIAKSVIPMYREIAVNPVYAEEIVDAINSKNEARLRRLVRSTVRSPYLTSVRIDFSGMFLGFKYPGSKFVYYNEVFREYVV